MYILNLRNLQEQVKKAKAPLTKSFDNNRSAGMSNVLAGTNFSNMQDLEKNDDCTQII